MYCRTCSTGGSVCTSCCTFHQMDATTPAFSQAILELKSHRLVCRHGSGFKPNGWIRICLSIIYIKWKYQIDHSKRGPGNEATLEKIYVPATGHSLFMTFNCECALMISELTWLVSFFWTKNSVQYLWDLVTNVLYGQCRVWWSHFYEHRWLF